MRYLISSPAAERLGWILDGLNGAADWGGDAADVLAPEFAALMPPDAFAERVRQRAAAFAPAPSPAWTRPTRTGNCEVLTIDSVQPLERNLATVLRYVTN